MRLANHGGRLVIVPGDEVVDVAAASEGRFGPDPRAVYDAWDDFTAWAAQGRAPTGKLDEATLGPVSPQPRQVFAVGLDYAGQDLSEREVQRRGQPPQFSLAKSGTPAGVGQSRRPPRFLAPGDVLETTVEGLGAMRHRLISPAG